VHDVIQQGIQVLAAQSGVTEEVDRPRPSVAAVTLALTRHILRAGVLSWLRHAMVGLHNGQGGRR